VNGHIRVVLFGSSRVSGSSLFLVYACDLLCDLVCVPIGIVSCVTLVLYVGVGHMRVIIWWENIFCVLCSSLFFLLSFSTVYLCHCL